MNGLPATITRERLLELAQFKPVEHLTRAVERTVEALDAVTPIKSITTPQGLTYSSGGEADHEVRLKAADRIFDLADVRKPRNDGADPTRPVNVNILIGDRSATSQVTGRSGYVLELRPQQVVDDTGFEHKPSQLVAGTQPDLPDLSQGCA